MVNNDIVLSRVKLEIVKRIEEEENKYSSARDEDISVLMFIAKTEAENELENYKTAGAILGKFKKKFLSEDDLPFKMEDEDIEELEKEEDTEEEE